MSIFVKDIPVLETCYCESYMLLDKVPKFKYINRAKTKDIEGYYYTVLVPHKEQYLQVNVKVMKSTSLDVSHNQGKLPLVSFKNLSLSYYLPTKKRSLEMTGEADDIVLFGDNTVKENEVFYQHFDRVDSEIIEEDIKQQKESVLTRLTRSKFKD